MSGIATIICLLVGYPFAFMMSKINPKYRPLLLFLVVLPFWTNSLIRIYGMKVFLGVKGVLNTMLMDMGILSEPIRILNTEIAVIIGLVYLLLPFMILPLYSAIEKLDGRLLEAARDLGANAFQRFFRVILPLTMPGIIAGCLLVLLPAMGMFYVADLLGGAKVLLVGNVIKSEFLISRNWPFGSAISIGLTVLMALLIFVYYRANKLLNKKVEFRIMSRLLRNAFMFVVYAYLYIPIIILVTNSFNEDRYGLSWKGFSWNWYERLFNNDTLIQAAIHSVTIAFFAATLATIVGGLTAIALYRYRFRGKQAVSGMLFIVMMSPDIVMAVSLLALFMVVGISLGFWSLLLAHVTFCLPYVTVTIFSRLNGFDSRMLEAAKDLGASEVTILRKLSFLLALPAVVSGWLLSFTISLDDVVVSSFVSGVSYEILPLRIFSLVKTGVTPEVNALATIMIVLSLALVVLSQLITRKNNH